MNAYVLGYAAYELAPRCPYERDTPEEMVWYVHSEKAVKNPFKLKSRKWKEWENGYVDAFSKSMEFFKVRPLDKSLIL